MYTNDIACHNDRKLSNPGTPVTICIVIGITGKCFSKAFTKHNIEKEFHVTGIYPINENSFWEDDSNLPMSLTELTVG
jgi:hypothetical protein